MTESIVKDTLARAAWRTVYDFLLPSVLIVFSNLTKPWKSPESVVNVVADRVMYPRAVIKTSNHQSEWIGSMYH
jgi:hypothetical protein